MTEKEEGGKYPLSIGFFCNSCEEKYILHGNVSYFLSNTDEFSHDCTGSKSKCMGVEDEFVIYACTTCGHRTKIELGILLPALKEYKCVACNGVCEMMK